MELTTGIQATLTVRGNEGKDASETDVRTVLFAAWPTMWGLDGVEVEQVDGPTWLVTLPSEAWELIQDEGTYEYGTTLGHGQALATLRIDCA